MFDDRHNRAIAAEERAEQLSQQVAGLLSELRAAEGERDRWENAAADAALDRRTLSARVATLEATLQETAHTLHDLWRCNTGLIGLSEEISDITHPIPQSVDDVPFVD